MFFTIVLCRERERERERSRERKRERAKEGERDREGDKEREGGEDSLREGERETAIKRESPTKRGGVKIKKSRFFCFFSTHMSFLLKVLRYHVKV